MKKILFSILFATFCFVAANAQQFGDWEIVCWDSAGVTVPLFVRTSTGNSSGGLIRTFYKLEKGSNALDPKKVVPTVGTIGNCGSAQTDTIIVRLDSLIQNTTEPQTCDCAYTLSLENHSVTIPDNSSRPIWHYNKVIRRDCGAGAEIIASSPRAVINSGELGIPRNGYNLAAASLATGGVVDSVKVFAANPSESFNVYLSPALVANRYPSLLTAGFDTSTLRVNLASVASFNTAAETVMAYALGRWANTHSPILPPPQYYFDAKLLNTGALSFHFGAIQNPIGPMVGVNNTASTRRIWYKTTASGSALNSQTVFFTGCVSSTSESYVLPCAKPDLSVSGSLFTTDGGFPGIDSITVDTSPTPTVSTDSDVCTGPCPEDGGCVEICNDVSNPVPVVVISDPMDCPVLGLVEFPLPLTAASGTLSGNTYHSVTVSVTSGTVVISAINPSSTTTGTFTTGQTFTVSAKDCTLIPTSFTINATSGAAVVASTR